MSEVDRRTFVASLATALPVLGAASGQASVAPASPARRALDEAQLRAVAEAILPSELGEAGLARAVAAFQAWLHAYEPGAEVNHGYGTPEIKYLPADPAAGWQAQLDALDREAARRWGARLATLDLERRRALVRGQLTAEAGERLPAAHDARHVAVGLLAWFYATPEATDLCYRARIGKETCRPLTDTRDEPVPLGGR